MPIDCDVLVLAAHPLELCGLLPTLGASLQGEVSGRRVCCAEIGVGLAAAGIGSARALAEFEPKAVVLLGSYGFYPGQAGQLLELAAVTHLRLLDAHAIDGAVAFPQPMSTELSLDGGLAAGLAAASGLLTVTMATTLAITVSDTLASTLAGYGGCRGENLEAFAVALACAQQKMKMAALLGATNQVGSMGRSQWQRNHAAAAECTATALLHWLSVGAPGL